MADPMNPNFKPGVGRLATDRFDFQKHVNGEKFHHTAEQIDMNPALSLGINVQESLENVDAFIISQIGRGAGFITVGDGYDTWHNAESPYFYDAYVPALNLLLNPVFDAILAGSDVPPEFERLKRGGILVIKSGTYIITDTINVPPGITIYGEGYGTKLVNATSLNLTPVPPTPKLVPTTKTLFKIKADVFRASNDGAVDPDLFMFSRETKIANLVIADNFVEPTLLGDNFYKLPQNKTYLSQPSSSMIPLISVEEGAHFTLDAVKAMGRANYTGPTVSAVTSHLIKTVTGNPTGTIINVKNCFIDGFSVPVVFESLQGNKDYLTLFNNYIRYYGYLNDDFTLADNNACIKTTVCNIDVQQNYLFGYDSTSFPLLYLTAVIASSVPEQGRSKIIFSNNQVAIDKTNNSILTTAPIQAASAVIAAPTKYTLVHESNILNDKYDLYVDRFSSVPQLSITSTLFRATSSNISLEAAANLFVSGPVIDIDCQGNLIGMTGSGISVDTSTGSGDIIVDTGSGEIFVDTNNLEINANSITANSRFNLVGRLNLNTVSTDIDYIVATDDIVILVDTTSVGDPITITLPAHEAGRILIIKDTTGDASIYNITLARNGGTGTIEGIASNAVLSADFGSWTIVSNGSSGWYFI